MDSARPYSQSAYIEFSKLRSAAKFNLAASGIMSYPLRELDVRLEDIEINGPSIYGYAPLLEAIAEMKGVAPESVVFSEGTSMANYLAMSALFAPDDEVLIEEPAYDSLINVALYLGAKVRRFQRRVEDQYALDPDQVAKNLTPRTRLIVITNMHNPSSVLGTEQSLQAIGELANEVGARVLVDEVYLELLHHPPAPTAFHLGEQFVVTSSLTKAYGLGGLRCGWILAEPGLAQRMWRLNDLFAGNPVHIGELLSVVAIRQRDKLARRADVILEANRAALIEMLDRHPALEMTIPPVGTTVFPRLRQGDVSGFCNFLRETYETSVVPGKYFERPEYFRVGISGDVEMTREGLTRLAEALSAWGK